MFKLSTSHLQKQNEWKHVKPHFTDIVTSRETDVVFFSCLRHLRSVDRLGARGPMSSTKTYLRRKHRTSVAFTWRHYQSCSEMKFISYISAIHNFIVVIKHTLHWVVYIFGNYKVTIQCRNPISSKLFEKRYFIVLVCRWLNESWMGLPVSAFKYDAIFYCH